ncbi:MAG: SGNH/GDSL hydrolase family protein [Candidatus Neomarinimicrobiota bacterium]
MRSILADIELYILLIAILDVGAMISGCSLVSSGGDETTALKQASTLIAERGDTTWDLVALGDSTPTGSGVSADLSYVQVYSAYIEEDLGVDVVVKNWATNMTQTVADHVEAVRSGEELREDLRNAEVITIWLGWHDLIPNIGIGRGGPCYERADEVDVDCLGEVTNPMREGFDKLLSEIVSLASPDETLILIADVGIPSLFVARWKEYGTLDVLKRDAYEVWREYIIQAARKYQVHVVNTYEVLNGPNGDQETPPQYMQSDGLHFNEQGHKLIADLHRRVGYEYSR